MRGREFTNEFRRSLGETLSCGSDGEIEVGAKRVVKASDPWSLGL
jgi:hypothetical protein